MPHLTIDYTANLEATADMPGLCQRLCSVLTTLKDDAGGPLFPVAGTRVMARPAPAFAVADGQPDRAFIFILARITAGRNAGTKQRAGDALMAAAHAHLAPVFDTQALGLTLHIDEGAPVYEGKQNNMAAHLSKDPSPRT